MIGFRVLSSASSLLKAGIVLIAMNMLASMSLAVPPEHTERPACIRLYSLEPIRISPEFDEIKPVFGLLEEDEYMDEVLRTPKVLKSRRLYSERDGRINIILNIHRHIRKLAADYRALVRACKLNSQKIDQLQVEALALDVNSPEFDAREQEMQSELDQLTVIPRQLLAVIAEIQTNREQLKKAHFSLGRTQSWSRF